MVKKVIKKSGRKQKFDARKIKYPWGEWQSVQLDIDLASDSFDMLWAREGQPLELVGTDLVFRSGALDHLDRFSHVHFTGLETPAHSAIDNVSVAPAGMCEPCDMNCDTFIDALDIEPFIGLLFNGDDPCCGERGVGVGFTGDVNLDGSIDALDIEGFIGCLFP